MKDIVKVNKLDYCQYKLLISLLVLFTNTKNSTITVIAYD